MKRLYFLLLLWIPLFLWSYPKYEMRGAWIATVANIDWPSQSNLSTQEQQDEMIAILDSLEKAHFNAVFFQIRPCGDAFYESEIEPWSKYLSGRQGVEPADFYDPLAFVCNEAHKRCIEVHAWINPYRILNSNRIEELYTDHLYHRHPEYFIKYASKWYFNPGLEQTQYYLNRVVEDIVSRYDIDAIHMDDYFYPYPVNGLEFKDYSTYQRYPRGFTNIEDWRRDNVTSIVKLLSSTIKRIKPWVEFGISPFGVWRNYSIDKTGSYSQAGITNYDDLYADINLWMKDSLIDYVVPQLYWSIGRKDVDYVTLLGWWRNHSRTVSMYSGMAIYKLGDSNLGKAWNRGNEICRQLDVNRETQRVNGQVMYPVHSILKDTKGILDSLKNIYYLYPSIVPPCLHIPSGKTVQPANMRVEKLGKRRYLFWDEVYDNGGYEVAYYIVYLFPGEQVGDISNPVYIYTKTIDTVVDLSQLEKELDGQWTFVVTAINRFKQESEVERCITLSL